MRLARQREQQNPWNAIMLAGFGLQIRHRFLLPFPAEPSRGFLGHPSQVPECSPEPCWQRPCWRGGSPGTLQVTPFSVAPLAAEQRYLKPREGGPERKSESLYPVPFPLSRCPSVFLLIPSRRENVAFNLKKTEHRHNHFLEFCLSPPTFTFDFVCGLVFVCICLSPIFLLM